MQNVQSPAYRPWMYIVVREMLPWSAPRNFGENIAYGQRSPEEVMRVWMNSSGHRANILNGSFNAIGVGHYQDSAGTDYWCQLFLTE